MVFVHSNTNFEVHSLEYIWNQSTYVKIWEWKGKMKPTWVDDKTFNLSWIKESTYKLTFKWNIDISWSEKLKVLSGIYLWNYKVIDSKIYEWVKLVTQKILLTKIENAWG